jgi:hypothetical protein
VYFRGDNYGFIQSPECILTEHKMAQGWRKTLGFMDANLKYDNHMTEILLMINVIALDVVTPLV